MIPHHWRRAAADNGFSDPNADVRPGRFANTVLGAIRGLMATGAAARDDAIGGLVATLGAGNVYSVSTNEGLIDIGTGINGIPAAITTPFLLRLAFDTALSGSSTNVPHLKVDGYDCGPILNRNAGALSDGDLTVGPPLLVLGELAASTDTKVTRVRVLDLLPSDLTISGGFPIGGIMPFTGRNTPAGFLPANGAVLQRSSYPKLFDHAQASQNIVGESDWLGNNGVYQGKFSGGDGASTFRLPNLSGMFLRAVDDGRGLDPGRDIGRVQSDAFRSHAHSLTGGGGVVQYYGTGPSLFLSTGNQNNGYYGANIANAGDSETRPVNIAYPFLIRAY